MNTTTAATRTAAFAYAATLTLAMLASVGALFGHPAQTDAELAAAATGAATQVVVIEGKRIART